MNIILFGFKGCGKTYFGRLVAKKLHRRFIDTDDRIIDLYEAKYRHRTIPNVIGYTCRDIALELGEAAFRQLEREAIASCQEVQDSVIAVGGGAVIDLSNVEVLQRLGKMAYLKTSFEVLSHRILGKVKPSYIDEKDPLGSWRQLYQERLPIYESIPAALIDTDVLDKPGIVAALKLLGQ
jgi:shikimate kinase